MITPKVSQVMDDGFTFDVTMEDIHETDDAIANALKRHGIISCDTSEGFYLFTSQDEYDKAWSTHNPDLIHFHGHIDSKVKMEKGMAYWKVSLREMRKRKQAFRPRVSHKTVFPITARYSIKPVGFFGTLTHAYIPLKENEKIDGWTGLFEIV